MNDERQRREYDKKLAKEYLERQMQELQQEGKELQKKMRNEMKKILVNQLELLLEHSLLCDDTSLAPITEQMLDIVRLLE